MDDWRPAHFRAGLLMGRLLSVNVGLPHDLAWRGETVRTAIWKDPVQDRRMVRRLQRLGYEVVLRPTAQAA